MEEAVGASGLQCSRAQKPPGHETRSARYAGDSRDILLLKTDSFRCGFIQGWSLGIRVSVTGEVSVPQVVSKEQNDVGQLDVFGICGHIGFLADD